MQVSLPQPEIITSKKRCLVLNNTFQNHFKFCCYQAPIVMTAMWNKQVI